MISSGSEMSMLSVGDSGSGQSISAYVILSEEKEASSQEIAEKIEEVCSDMSAEIEASGSAMDMGAYTGSGISIQVTGEDLDILQKEAGEIAGILENVKGLEEISDGIEDPAPEIRITVDKSKAMAEGLTVAQVYMDISNVLSDGNTATTLMQEDTEYSVIVANSAAEEMAVSDIENHKIKITDEETKETREIALKDIAEIKEAAGLSSISRTNQNRYLNVTATVADGYNVTRVSQRVEKELGNYQAPQGITIEYAGENEEIMNAMGQMVKMLLLGVVFIYLIMVAQFQSLLSPFIIMFTIPLAFTGGFMGLLIAGLDVSVIAMLGFVMLSGIIVNNGIVLVDYINQLRVEGVARREAIVEAGVTRMRPILMTAITTILGLSSMALGVGMGSDIIQPIAVVTVGGLIYATLMTLFVVPVLYEIMSRKKMKVIQEKELEIIDD